MIALVCACRAEQAPARPAPAGPSAEPSASAGLRRTAEASLLPLLNPQAANLVRNQTWFQGLNSDGLALVEALVACDLAARRRGETDSVSKLLQFASEQPWYQDGLDDRESLVLTGVFQAYAESLADDNAPPIGPVLASTLRHQLFEVAALPETGRFVLLVSAADARLGVQALRLALDALPRIEKLLGRYPYTFMHIDVTDDLPATYAGLSYDQFIALSEDYVDAETVIHEIVHSTLYGLFPTWFEEGMAHFVEHYLTDSLEAGVRSYNTDLRRLARDSRLDIRPNRLYTFSDELAERAQGFLFLNGVYTILNADGLSTAMRTLRTKTLGDQELLRVLVQQGPLETQARLAQHVCRSVIGTTRDYCAAQ